MISKKIQRFLKNLFWKQKRKTNVSQRSRISLYEQETLKFKRRRTKSIITFLKRFSIWFSKRLLLIYVTVGWFLIVWWAFLLLLWPFLDVKDVYITRGNTNVNIDLAYRAIDSIRWKKIFSLDKGNIRASILRYQESIDNIDIDISLPNSISINITAYENLFQTIINEKKYIIVENGAFLPLKSTSETPYLNIYTNRDFTSTTPDYKKVLEKKYLQSILLIKNTLIENIIHLQVKELHYYREERELIIELEKWGDVIFDLTKNLSQQVEKLVIFNNEGGDITKRNLIYTDLRINNKVFFCDGESEFFCRLNLKEIYGTRKSSPKPTESEVSSLSLQ